MEKYIREGEDIAVLHFTGAVKPWNNRILTLSDHFWRYVKGSAFEGQITAGYAKIPMKRYIGLHFIDVTDGGYEITASLYSLDGSRYEDVVVTVDSAVTDTSYRYGETIEIDGRVYIRTFFTFRIPLFAVKDRSGIRFYDKVSGDRLKCIFAATFPLESSLRGYAQTR